MKLHLKAFMLASVSALTCVAPVSASKIAVEDLREKTETTVRGLVHHSNAAARPSDYEAWLRSLRAQLSNGKGSLIEEDAPTDWNPLAVLNVFNHLSGQFETTKVSAQNHSYETYKTLELKVSVASALYQLKRDAIMKPYVDQFKKEGLSEEDAIRRAGKVISQEMDIFRIFSEDELKDFGGELAELYRLEQAAYRLNAEKDAAWTSFKKLPNKDIMFENPVGTLEDLTPVSGSRFLERSHHANTINPTVKNLVSLRPQIFEADPLSKKASAARLHYFYSATFSQAPDIKKGASLKKEPKPRKERQGSWAKVLEKSLFKNVGHGWVKKNAEDLLRDGRLRGDYTKGHAGLQTLETLVEESDDIDYLLELSQIGSKSVQNKCFEKFSALLKDEKHPLKARFYGAFRILKYGKANAQTAEVVKGWLDEALKKLKDLPINDICEVLILFGDRNVAEALFSGDLPEGVQQKVLITLLNEPENTISNAVKASLLERLFEQRHLYGKMLPMLLDSGGDFVRKNLLQNVQNSIKVLEDDVAALPDRDHAAESLIEFIFALVPDPDLDDARSDALLALAGQGKYDLFLNAFEEDYERTTEFERLKNVAGKKINDLMNAIRNNKHHPINKHPEKVVKIHQQTELIPKIDAFLTFFSFGGKFDLESIVSSLNSEKTSGEKLKDLKKSVNDSTLRSLKNLFGKTESYYDSYKNSVLQGVMGIVSDFSKKTTEKDRSDAIIILKSIMAPAELAAFFKKSPQLLTGFKKLVTDETKTVDERFKALQILGNVLPKDEMEKLFRNSPELLEGVKKIATAPPNKATIDERFDAIKRLSNFMSVHDLTEFLTNSPMTLDALYAIKGTLNAKLGGRVIDAQYMTLGEIRDLLNVRLYLPKKDLKDLAKGLNLTKIRLAKSQKAAPKVENSELKAALVELLGSEAAVNKKIKDKLNGGAKKECELELLFETLIDNLEEHNNKSPFYMGQNMGKNKDEYESLHDMKKTFLMRVRVIQGRKLFEDNDCYSSWWNFPGSDQVKAMFTNNLKFIALKLKKDLEGDDAKKRAFVGRICILLKGFQACQPAQKEAMETALNVYLGDKENTAAMVATDLENPFRELVSEAKQRVFDNHFDPGGLNTHIYNNKKYNLGLYIGLQGTLSNDRGNRSYEHKTLLKNYFEGKKEQIKAGLDQWGFQKYKDGNKIVIEGLTPDFLAKRVLSGIQTEADRKIDEGLENLKEIEANIKEYCKSEDEIKKQFEKQIKDLETRISGYRKQNNAQFATALEGQLKSAKVRQKNALEKARRFNGGKALTVGERKLLAGKLITWFVDRGKAGEEHAIRNKLGVLGYDGIMFEFLKTVNDVESLKGAKKTAKINELKKKYGFDAHGRVNRQGFMLIQEVELEKVVLEKKQRFAKRERAITNGDIMKWINTNLHKLPRAKKKDFVTIIEDENDFVQDPETKNWGYKKIEIPRLTQFGYKTDDGSEGAINHEGVKTVLEMMGYLKSDDDALGGGDLDFNELEAAANGQGNW